MLCLLHSCRWCNPCKILTPLLEEVVSKAKGNVDLAKVDIDELPDLALEYNVRESGRVVGRRRESVERGEGIRG